MLVTNDKCQIRIRPHHLLDIIRDYGNEIERDAHPYGASLKEVTDVVLSNIDKKVRLVSRVDSICITCSKLRDNICYAKINDDLLMRDYNDNLDDKLFNVMKLSPESELTVRAFLEIVNRNLSSIIAQFSSTSNKLDVRKAGTVRALKNLKLD